MIDQKDDWHLTEDLHNQTGRGDPFAAAVRATRMPMVITDPRQPDNPIVFANQAFQKLTGYDRDEIVGRNCRFLQGTATDLATVLKVREAVESGRDIDIDILNYRRDGSSFWNALYISPVRSDSGDIQFFFASQMDVTDRIEAQQRIAEQKAIFEREVQARTADLEEALEAKTLLLREVDHRVKNNLTMIGALLRLQARTINDPVVAAKLGSMLERVDALATVHRRLYQSGDITRFDLSAFAINLIADVIGASGRTDITVRTEVQPLDVRSDQAAPLGLVLNELLTNSIKHAFADGRSGVLSIKAGKTSEGYSVSISDDGSGFNPADGQGLGMTLVRRLSKQAGASVEWSDAEPGTCVTLRGKDNP